MSQKHGNIFSLWFGSRLVIVISSLPAFQECFTKNNVVLANRPRSLAGKSLFYDYTTVGSCSYGEHWRNLCRIISIDVLSNQRILSFSGIRRDETNRLIWTLAKYASFDDDFAQEQCSKKEREDSMIDHLLSLQELSQPRYYTDEIIKGLILAMLFARTDSSSSTLEWALCNLLNHPEILKKTRDELDTHIGQDQLLNEFDLSKLPYLKNIILETLRLYPPAPLLIPHVFR
ncbi:hypothetical protein RIF29_10617 [Crotalaria pallida]|uniref:Cytochrome P450 n=1 Tax=Crotalaria pallida TaxID=3830 RepID=A0AAN9IKU3_CROPI